MTTKKEKEDFKARITATVRYMRVIKPNKPKK